MCTFVRRIIALMRWNMYKTSVVQMLDNSVYTFLVTKVSIRMSNQELLYVDILKYFYDFFLILLIFKCFINGVELHLLFFVAIKNLEISYLLQQQTLVKLSLLLCLIQFIGHLLELICFCFKECLFRSSFGLHEIDQFDFAHNNLHQLINGLTCLFHILLWSSAKI